MAGEQPLLGEFVSEAKEHLANVTDDLLTIEKDASAAVPYRIDRLFRAMHSIKGGADFVGLRQIARLAHALETVLGELRQQSGPLPAGMVDALLGGVDLIHTMLDDPERSHEVDITKALAPLQPATPLTPTVAPTPAATLAELGFRLNSEQMARLAGFAHLWALRCDLTQLHQERGLTPQALTSALAGVVAIIEGFLEVPSADLASGPLDGPVIYHALLGSMVDLTTLSQATGLLPHLFTAVGIPQPTPAPMFREVLPVPSTTAEPVTTVAGKLVPVDERVSSIRIHVHLLDRLMTLAGELVLVRNQTLTAVDQQEPQVRRIVQRLSSVTSELQEAIMLTRLQPVGNVFQKFPRLVRDLARQLGKQIIIDISGNEVELDKSILEILADPLTHLIRNCCDHGIESPELRVQAGKPETGHITLRASHEGSQILIEVADDGRGIDPQRIRAKALQLGLKTPAEIAALSEKECLNLILLPGFSTAREVTDLSGRGVGMDVVKTNLDRMGGGLEIESVLGEGSTFFLRLPLTVAIIPCLLVVSGGQRYAIPQKDLEELICLHPGQPGRIEQAHDQEVFRRRKRLLPVVRLAEVLARPRPFTQSDRVEILQRYRDQESQSGEICYLVVVKAGSARFGLVVEQIQNTEEIVVKPMHGSLRRLHCYSGATIMGDGRVALILDIEGIARHAGIPYEIVDTSPALSAEADSRAEKQALLLFQSGPEEQFAVPLAMIRRLVLLDPKQIERIGQQEFVTIDNTSLQVLRLEHFLPVSPCRADGLLYLLLPRHIRQPVGLLLSRVLDTMMVEIELNTQAYRADGILGSALLGERLTLFLDLFRLAERANPDAQDRPAQALTGPRRRVLLVEDTRFFRQLVRRYLTEVGLDVVTALHGAQGLEQLEEQDFDLIVSDIEMPIMDGWTFARAVRQHSRGGRLPLLALTTLSSDSDRAKALECGFDRYEVKLDRERFLTAVRELLQGRQESTRG